VRTPFLWKLFFQRNQIGAIASSLSFHVLKTSCFGQSTGCPDWMMMLFKKLKAVPPTPVTLLAPVAFVGLLMPAHAHAHLGHLGDLAGHSHWAGIALAGCAAALGGLLAAKGSAASDTDTGAENNDETIAGQPEGDGHGDIGDEAHA
jgi:hypothetical protein